MFNKQETEEQLVNTRNVFVSVEAYIAQRKKLDNAFTVLESKAAKTKEDHKISLRQAGATEAKRLLGEIDETESQELDVSFTQIRDQQHRLDAALEALKLQKNTLDADVKHQVKAASTALTDLSRSVQTELNEELKRAAAQINSIAHRLYAFYKASGLYSGNKTFLEMVIPAIGEDKNLFIEPVFYHPRTNELMRSMWESTPEAVSIYDQLKDLGGLYHQLARLEREYDRTNEETA